MPVEKAAGCHTDEEADVKLEDEETEEGSGNQLLPEDVLEQLKDQEDEGLGPPEPHSVQQVEESARRVYIYS